jgi:hypothetical protein
MILPHRVSLLTPPQDRAPKLSNELLYVSYVCLSGVTAQRTPEKCTMYANPESMARS